MDGRFRVGWREKIGFTPLAVATDSKGSYDHLKNATTSPPEDQRPELEVILLRQDLTKCSPTLCWANAGAPTADPVTKFREDSEVLRAVLRSGKMVIVGEQLALRMKKVEGEERRARRGGGTAGCNRRHNSPKVSESCVLVGIVQQG